MYQFQWRGPGDKNSFRTWIITPGIVLNEGRSENISTRRYASDCLLEMLVCRGYLPAMKFKELVSKAKQVISREYLVTFSVAKVVVPEI